MRALCNNLSLATMQEIETGSEERLSTASTGDCPLDQTVTRLVNSTLDAAMQELSVEQVGVILSFWLSVTCVSLAKIVVLLKLVVLGFSD